MDIDILLATYNGAGYLREQLDSIVAQSLHSWRVVAHDDGSKDGTVDILKEYAAQDGRIRVLEDGIRLGSAAANFMHLLKSADADATICCDQDDIWLPQKLEKLAVALESVKGPGAAYCNAYGYRDGKVVAEKVTLFSRRNLQEALFQNSGVQGCSLMMNRALVEVIKAENWQHIAMHDHLFTIAALAIGELVYVDESLMYYRQHDNNVTGAVPTDLADRIRQFRGNKAPLLDPAHYEANREVYEKLAGMMETGRKNTFKAYLDFPGKGLPGRIASILRNGFGMGASRNILLAKTLLKKPI